MQQFVFKINGETSKTCRSTQSGISVNKTKRNFQLSIIGKLFFVKIGTFFFRLIESHNSYSHSNIIQFLANILNSTSFSFNQQRLLVTQRHFFHSTSFTSMKG